MPISRSHSQKFLIDLEWSPDPEGFTASQNVSHMQQMPRAAEVELSVREGMKVAVSDYAQSLFPKLLNC